MAMMIAALPLVERRPAGQGTGWIHWRWCCASWTESFSDDPEPPSVDRWRQRMPRASFDRAATGGRYRGAL